MSNSSKIVILILLVLSFFFIKERYGTTIEKILNSFGSISKVEFNKKDNNADSKERIKKPITQKDVDKLGKNIVEIYFLALDSNDNGIYRKVHRELPPGENKFEYAIKELLKGPNVIEKAQGTYTEIPKTTKLLSIKQTEKKIIINFSEDFQNGGGTDSIYSRMMQLIKTAINNTKNKKIYLYLNGKQVNIIGGEGIMITQPLTEKSLEI